MWAHSGPLLAEGKPTDVLASPEQVLADSHKDRLDMGRLALRQQHHLLQIVQSRTKGVNLRREHALVGDVVFVHDIVVDPVAAALEPLDGRFDMHSALVRVSLCYSSKIHSRSSIAYR